MSVHAYYDHCLFELLLHLRANRQVLLLLPLRATPAAQAELQKRKLNLRLKCRLTVELKNIHLRRTTYTMAAFAWIIKLQVAR